MGVLFNNNGSNISKPSSTGGGILFNKNNPVQSTQEPPKVTWKEPRRGATLEEMNAFTPPEGYTKGGNVSVSNPKKSFLTVWEDALKRNVGQLLLPLQVSKDITLNASKNALNVAQGKPLEYKPNYSASQYLTDINSPLNPNKIQNPLLRGAATGTAELAYDPLTYFAGGVADNLIKSRALVPGAAYDISKVGDRATQATKGIHLQNGNLLRTQQGKDINYIPKGISKDIQTPNVINNAADFSPKLLTSAKDPGGFGLDISDYDLLLKDYKSQSEKLINDQIQYLKDSGGKGVEQGSLFRNSLGEVVGRQGRISNNSKWYRDFYAENGRAPRQSEYREIAINQLKNGYLDDAGAIPPDKTFNAFDEIISDTAKGKQQYEELLKPTVTQNTKEIPRAVTPGELQTIQGTSKPLTAAAPFETVKSEAVSWATKPKVFGEPTIPAGQKERGFSANTRTDVNNPDTLRESFTEKPLSYEQISNPTTLSKAQEIFNQGFEPARTQVSELAGQMKPEAVPLAKMLARQATESGNVQGAREILSDVADKLTQAGQFTQAARLLRESDPETFLMTISKQLKKLNKEGSEIYGKKWNNVDLTQDELNMIGNIKRGDQASYESTFEKIGNRIAKQMPATGWEKMNEWRHVAMLLNPKTQIRNVAGNTLMLGMRRTAKEVSAVLQNVFLKPENRTQVVKIKPEYQQAAKEYFETNKNDLLKGANKFNESVTLKGLSANKRVFQNNVLEKTRQGTYKLLEMGDTPFYKNAYTNRLASYAQAKGIKDFSKLPQEAFDIAKKEAEQATYKDVSNLANYLNKLKHPGKDASFWAKAGSVIGEAVLPFTKTPINIVRRGIQYSPAGIINAFAMIKPQGATAAIDEMAKGLTGTGIMGLGYLLAKSGILTGKADNDKDLANYDRNTGNAPFSIMGKYTYDWAQPFAVPLTVGVEIYNAVKDKPEEAAKMEQAVNENDQTKLGPIGDKFINGILNALNASGDTVFNMSVLKGIQTFFGQGTQGLMKQIAQIPLDYATQMIPTFSGQAAGTIDPTVRQTYFTGNPIETAKATALSKIPFASKSLQPKLSPYGEPITRPQSVPLRAFTQFLSPGNVTVPQSVPKDVDTELRRLATAGEKSQFPTSVPPSFNFDKQKLTITPKESTPFQQTLGQETLKKFQSTIKTPEYQALSDPDKAQALSKDISAAKKQAEFGVLQSRGIASNPEIMNVPTSLTYNKVDKELTLDQKKELADMISKNQDILLKANPKVDKAKIYQVAKDRAYAEMKVKLFKK